ncbi:hypothetical protein LCM02_12180 [Lutimonas saemankumensis]|uniref:PID-CTERM protein-sorting domain-containing protein n=1 Tax=Lutimonas saemankumensis TaxID=483016 RepID=UPI001CD70947|nr:hypothetical protein [Lutimonas saemankumensis]MCA0933213.1 hypothetical protein [Lutimonas saemankumensis]
MANKYFKAIFFLALLLVTSTSFAQGPPPPPPKYPIDGGVIGLLLLGVGYAVKKIHENSKK